MTTPFPGYTRLRERATRHRFPLHAQLELTHRCNQRCQHCYLRDQLHDDSSCLSFSQVESLLDELLQMQTLFLSLTGGEFFMRPDACEILRAVRKRGFAFLLLTNGTMLTQEDIECIAECTPVEVHLSLLGLEDTHDELSGTPGAYKKTIWAMDQLRDRGVRVRAKIILTSASIHDLDAIEAVAEAHADAHVRAIDLIPTIDGEVAPQDLTLGTDEMRTLRCQDAEPCDEIHTDRDRPKPDAIVCNAGRSLLAIDPNGDVYPCISFRRRMGNVLQTPLREIWNSAEMREVGSLTEKDLAECGRCADRLYCAFCPGQSWLAHGDYTRPAASLCERARKLRATLDPE